MEKISSLDNQKIKNIVKLRKARERKKQDIVIIEGKKEIELALRAGVEIIDIFYCENFADDIEYVKSFDEDLVTIVTASVFRKISYRDTPDGFLAIAKPSYMEINDLQLSKNPLVLVLEAVEKPGNLGAILRSADASGVEAIIINDAKTDIFNPNVIRASRGTAFTVQVVNATRKDTIKYLKNNSIFIYAAALQAKKVYTDVDFKKSCAIIFGTEDKGISDEWMELVDEQIKIPMNGEIDSLNVSVSAGIIIYEVIRQRDI